MTNQWRTLSETKIGYHNVDLKMYLMTIRTKTRIQMLIAHVIWMSAKLSVDESQSQTKIQHNHFKLGKF